jgi:hypothetical protein
MSSTSRFQVHTPLLVMMSTGPKETYVTLSVGTVGEILDVPDKLSRPGLVTIHVYGETLYTFARDLQENTFIEPLACCAIG